MSMKILVILNIGEMTMTIALVVAMAAAHLIAQGTHLVLDSVDYTIFTEKGQCTENVALVYSVEGIFKVGEANRASCGGYGLRHHYAVCRRLYAVRREENVDFGVGHDFTDKLVKKTRRCPQNSIKGFLADIANIFIYQARRPIGRLSHTVILLERELLVATVTSRSLLATLRSNSLLGGCRSRLLTTEATLGSSSTTLRATEACRLAIETALRCAIATLGSITALRSSAIAAHLTAEATLRSTVATHLTAHLTAIRRDAPSVESIEEDYAAVLRISPLAALEIEVDNNLLTDLKLVYEIGTLISQLKEHMLGELRTRIRDFQNKLPHRKRLGSLHHIMNLLEFTNNLHLKTD